MKSGKKKLEKPLTLQKYMEQEEILNLLPVLRMMKSRKKKLEKPLTLHNSLYPYPTLIWASRS